MKGGAEVTRAMAILAVASMLALPAGAAAQFEDPGSGGSATACAYGNFVTGQSSIQSGWIPYPVSNSYTQVRTTMRNIDGGFIGTFSVSTYPSSRVSWGAPQWWWSGRQETLYGPTYTTPMPNTQGVPFTIELEPSEGVRAWSFYYTVCAG
jgi:hypothetical protein